MLGIVSVHQKLGDSHAASTQSQLPERTNLHGILISTMSSGTMIENVSVILNHLFGVLCCGSPEKLIYCRETCFILLIEMLDRKCYSNPFTNFGKLGNAYQDEKTEWIQRPLINFFTILIFFPSILQRIYFTLIWSHLH